jgi:hypothetical protein
MEISQELVYDSSNYKVNIFPITFAFTLLFIT